MPALNQLYDEYKGRVAFLVVYILEAHPSDVWQMESNLRDQVVFASPKDEDERGFVAGACVRKLGIKFPAVLDEFSNATERAYTGWPDRMYLIDGQGKVAYKSKPGPFGFTPDQLRAALERLLGRSARWEAPRQTGNTPSDGSVIAEKDLAFLVRAGHRGRTFSPNERRGPARLRQTPKGPSG